MLLLRSKFCLIWLSHICGRTAPVSSSGVPSNMANIFPMVFVPLKGGSFAGELLVWFSWCVGFLMYVSCSFFFFFYKKDKVREVHGAFRRKSSGVCEGCCLSVF